MLGLISLRSRSVESQGPTEQYFQWNLFCYMSEVDVGKQCDDTIQACWKN